MKINSAASYNDQSLNCSNVRFGNVRKIYKGNKQNVEMIKKIYHCKIQECS